MDFCFERDGNVLHVLPDHIIGDGGAMGRLCRAIAEACALPGGCGSWNPFRAARASCLAAVPLSTKVENVSLLTAFMACWMAAIWRTAGVSKMAVDNVIDPRFEAWMPRELGHVNESMGNVVIRGADPSNRSKGVPC